MKKFLIILIIVFICGFMSADICFTQIKDSSVIIGKETYEQYANAKLLFKDAVWNVFYERVKVLLMVLLLCFTPIKDRLSVILSLVFSFMWGFFLMSCIMEMGVAGLIVGLASVLPHGVLYGAGLGVLVNRRRARKYHLKNTIAIDIGVYVFMVLLLISAIVIETLVGVHFIPWVIRLSLI